MLKLVATLSTVLPIIAATLLLFVILINLYLKIRRKFPINVNCWFCNSWTKVPYDDRNSFDCPTCLQYNGFTKDGDYNKIIPEQHDELMNKSAQINTKKSCVSNGLCALCNNNLQLKIFQLANFVPLVEENYDVEIDHFQKQLEKAYKLCKKCDRVLKKTLDKQNAWIFGKHVKSICINGISKVADQIRKKTRPSILAKIDGFLSLLLVVLVAFITISSIKVFTTSLYACVPTEYLTLCKQVLATMNTSRVVRFSLLAPYYSKRIKIDPYSIICAIGFGFHTIKMLCGQITTATRVNQLLCWVILLLISWVRFNKSFSTYVLIIEAFCCLYLITTAFSKNDDKKHTSKTKGKAMRKLVRNLEKTYSDFSDVSDFENISSSSQNCESSRDSSCLLNKSTYSTLDVPLQHNYTFNTAGNVLNTSFVSAKSTLPNCDLDLNKSLNNLRLGGLDFKSPKCASTIVSHNIKRPKPVLSPPKFHNVNSWVAGGFWKDSEGLGMPLAQKTNLSRSSSESSGFGSQHNENLQFVLPKSNFGDYDKLSMNSEFSRLSPTHTFPFSQPDFRRINTVYPTLQPNNMLLIQRVGSPGLIRFNESYQGLAHNWSDKINSQATQSFKDLNLHSNK